MAEVGFKQALDQEMLKWSRGTRGLPPQRRKTMHNLMIALAFIAMVLAPCLIAFSNTPTEE